MNSGVAGAWSVAIAMSPVQKHLQRVVKNLGVALDLGSKPAGAT